MAIVAVAGCATVPATPAEGFLANLRSLCGQAYAGRIVSSDAADADMAGKPLVMHVRECSRDAIRIPFHVGDDRSRTWVVGAGKIISDKASGTAPAGWVILKHDHRHADGTPDALTDYGGESLGGTAFRRSFPADAFSRDLFQAKGNPASATNVWTLEIEPARRFAYELRRPSRHFRVEFDLTRPVPAPPPPWGAS